MRKSESSVSRDIFNDFMEIYKRWSALTDLVSAWVSTAERRQDDEDEEESEEE